MKPVNVLYSVSLADVCMVPGRVEVLAELTEPDGVLGGKAYARIVQPSAH